MIARPAACLLLLCLGACGADQAVLKAGPSVVEASREAAAPAGTAATLQAHVSYAGRGASLPAGAVLFVFVREPGSTMPLAVERMAPAMLPVVVEFTPQDHGPRRLEVVARLSRSGDVYLQAGDVEAVSPPVTLAQSTPARLELHLPELSLMQAGRHGRLAVDWHAEASALTAEASGR